MRNEHEILEKVRIYFQNLPSDFVIIYQSKSKLLPFKLKWRAGTGRRGTSRDDVEKLATTYIKTATYCYLLKRNLILAERLPGPRSKIRKWCGLSYAVGKDKLPSPTNSMGQSWWLVVIGKGLLRDAGYALVARTAAKSRVEVNHYIATILDIMK